MNANRRFSDRNAFEGTVQLFVHTPTGEDFSLECLVVNYSEVGIGLRTTQPVEVLASIRVIIGKDAYDGEVRYCTKSPLGFFSIGVKLVVQDARTSD